MKGSLHRLIRVKHNSANGIVDQTNGQAKTQAPLFRFALFSSLQAALQPMEFGLRHAALETEQQPVVMGSGIIDAFVINHQGLGQRTDFQQSIPIAARTRQARNLQAEHCPNVPQTHFSYQPLEAIAANGRCPRLSLILVDHLDTSRRPSQILGSLDEIILPGRTAGIFSNLEQRGLPHILSRDSIGLSKNTSHAGTTPSAISSISIATSIVSSSARRSAWRRRAISISRAAICPAVSPRFLAPARARSWLANIWRNTGTALFFGWACTHPKHTNPFGQYSPVGRAHRCVPISRRLQLAANAAHSSAVGLRKLSSP